jgi:hypothetical protein
MNLAFSVYKSDAKTTRNITEGSFMNQYSKRDWEWIFYQLEQYLAQVIFKKEDK